MKRRDLEARVGRLGQVAGVRRMILTDGPEAGVEQIEVRTGAGLAFHVSPQRGLDIGRLEYRGYPVSWESPAGNVHPAHYREDGLGWLRSAAGGFLMTCGMRQVGAPCEDAGESLGIHGRAHHTPASEVRAFGEWQGDHHVMAVAGVLREARLFGENLLLHRNIATELGSTAISISDRVENIGFTSSPIMMLYHFNLGWPFLGERTRIKFPSRRVVPRESGLSTEGYDRWETPQPGFSERVYYHEDIVPDLDEDGRPVARVIVNSPDFPGGACSLSIEWNTTTLNELVQWKMAGQGAHVLGIEPANCRVGGRASERQRGALRMIEPGESVDFSLEITLQGA